MHSPLTRVLTLSILVGLLAGCGINGTYKLHKIEPPDMAREFPLQKVTFKTDGTFSAEVGKGEAPRTIQGTYEFDKQAGKLHFHANDGTERVYAAKSCPACGYIKVSNPEGMQIWEATLRRR